ncbi:tetratricopeptide repeat protein, partial [Reyranella sp.]|uniref:tetratricopeptide repeat protein n=1 Tax=Reyranella sp. TaxID=1929291 RepID=UPI003D0DFF57
AVALAPGDADAHANRGATLLGLKRFDEALACYDRSLALRPGEGEAAWNKAQLLLLRGDLVQGLPLYEERRRKPEFPSVGDAAVPSWRPDMALAGRTVLVHWEQGMGDTIQFCRYLRPLAAQAGRVLFAPHRPLAALMHGLGPGLSIVDPDDPALSYDLRLPLLSLPLAFATTLDTIPGDVPYLGAEPERVERWRRRLGEGGLRIGICWQGNPSLVDRGRSFPLAALAGLARRPGTRLISLQKGHGVEQFAALPDGMTVETLGGDFDAGPDAFLDSAAVLQSLDLVITSDTAMAHLAGALARPVWVALKQVPDWRWFLDRPTSPWYPTMTLFRQKQRGDWAGVFDEMAGRLSDRRR